jgi:hypothetical protein
MIDLISTPQLLHACFYTPIASALKNYHAWGLLEVPTDFLNHFWIQVNVSPPKQTARRMAVSEAEVELETAATWPLLLEPKRPKRNTGYICDAHSPADKSARSGVTVMLRPRPAKGGFILVSSRFYK